MTGNKKAAICYGISLAGVLVLGAINVYDTNEEMNECKHRGGTYSDSECYKKLIPMEDE